MKIIENTLKERRENIPKNTSDIRSNPDIPNMTQEVNNTITNSSTKRTIKRRNKDTKPG